MADRVQELMDLGLTKEQAEEWILSEGMSPKTKAVEAPEISAIDTPAIEAMAPEPQGTTAQVGVKPGGRGLPTLDVQQLDAEEPNARRKKETQALETETGVSFDEANQFKQVMDDFTTMKSASLQAQGYSEESARKKASLDLQERLLYPTSSTGTLLDDDKIETGELLALAFGKQIKTTAKGEGTPTTREQEVAWTEALAKAREGASTGDFSAASDLARKVYEGRTTEGERLTAIPEEQAPQMGRIGIDLIKEGFEQAVAGGGDLVGAAQAPWREMYEAAFLSSDDIRQTITGDGLSPWEKMNRAADDLLKAPTEITSGLDMMLEGALVEHDEFKRKGLSYGQLLKRAYAVAKATAPGEHREDEREEQLIRPKGQMANWAAQYRELKKQDADAEQIASAADGQLGVLSWSDFPSTEGLPRPQLELLKREVERNQDLEASDAIRGIMMAARDGRTMEAQQLLDRIPYQELPMEMRARYQPDSDRLLKLSEEQRKVWEETGGREAEQLMTALGSAMLTKEGTNYVQGKVARVGRTFGLLQTAVLEADISPADVLSFSMESLVNESAEDLIMPTINKLHKTILGEAKVPTAAGFDFMLASDEMGPWIRSVFDWAGVHLNEVESLRDPSSSWAGRVLARTASGDQGAMTGYSELLINAGLDEQSDAVLYTEFFGAVADLMAPWEGWAAKPVTIPGRAALRSTSMARRAPDGLKLQAAAAGISPALYAKVNDLQDADLPTVAGHLMETHITGRIDKGQDPLAGLTPQMRRQVLDVVERVADPGEAIQELGKTLLATDSGFKNQTAAMMDFGTPEMQRTRKTKGWKRYRAGVDEFVQAGNLTKAEGDLQVALMETIAQRMAEDPRIERYKSPTEVFNAITPERGLPGEEIPEGALRQAEDGFTPEPTIRAKSLDDITGAAEGVLGELEGAGGPIARHVWSRLDRMRKDIPGGVDVRVIQGKEGRFPYKGISKENFELTYDELDLLKDRMPELYEKVIDEKGFVRDGVDLSDVYGQMVREGYAKELYDASQAATVQKLADVEVATQYRLPEVELDVNESFTQGFDLRSSVNQTAEELSETITYRTTDGEPHLLDVVIRMPGQALQPEDVTTIRSFLDEMKIKLDEEGFGFGFDFDFRGGAIRLNPIPGTGPDVYAVAAKDVLEKVESIVKRIPVEEKTKVRMEAAGLNPDDFARAVDVRWIQGRMDTATPGRFDEFQGIRETERPGEGLHPEVEEGPGQVGREDLRTPDEQRGEREALAAIRRDLEAPGLGAPSTAQLHKQRRIAYEELIREVDEPSPTMTGFTPEAAPEGTAPMAKPFTEPEGTQPMAKVPPTILRSDLDAPTDDPSTGRTLFQTEDGVTHGYVKPSPRHAKFLYKIFETGNWNTLFHEDGHLMRFFLEPIVADNLVKHFGGIKDSVTGKVKLTEEGEEAAAEAWRWYVRTRMAPTGAVQQAFDKMWVGFQNAWLRYHGKTEMLPRGMAESWDSILRPDRVVAPEAQIVSDAVRTSFPRIKLGERAAAVKAFKETRERFNRDDIMQHMMDAIDEESGSIPVDKLFAKAAGYVMSEEMRGKDMGKLIRLTTRTVIPASRLQRVQEDTLSFMRLNPKKLKVEDGRIIFNEDEASQINTVVKQLMREPMGRMLPREFVEKAAKNDFSFDDWSTMSVDDYNAIVETAIDVKAGVAARRSTTAEGASPTAAHAAVKLADKLVGKVGEDAIPVVGHMRSRFRKNFILGGRLKGLRPDVREVVLATERELGQLPSWLKKATREEFRKNPARSSAEVLKEIATGGSLTPPVAPGSVRKLFKEYDNFKRAVGAGDDGVALNMADMDESRVDAVRGILDEKGNATVEELGAIDILERFSKSRDGKKLQRGEQVELSETKTEELGEALAVIESALHARREDVFMKLRDLGHILGGKDGATKIDGALKKADRRHQPIKMYDDFFAGRWEDLFREAGPEGMQITDRNVDPTVTMAQFMIRLKAHDAISKMSRKLARIGVSEDLTGQIAKAAETPPGQGHMLADQEINVPNRNRYVKDIEKAFKDIIHGNVFVRGEGVSGPEIFTPRKREAYMKAKKLAAEWGIPDESSKFVDTNRLGTRMLVPDVVIQELDGAVDRISDLYGQGGRLRLSKLKTAKDGSVQFADPGVVSKTVNTLIDMNPLTLARIKMGMTTGLLLPNPAYYMANFVGNIFFVYQGLGAKGTMRALSSNPRTTMAVVSRMWKDGDYTPSAPAIVTKDGRIYTTSQITDMAMSEGLRSSFIQAETVNSIARDIRDAEPDFWAKMMGKVDADKWWKREATKTDLAKAPVNAAKWWQSNLIEGATAMDNYFRVAMFVDGLKQGSSPAEAADLARTAVLDYSALTDFERKYLRSGILFYSYMRKNMDLFFYTMARNPERILGQYRLAKDVHKKYIEGDPDIVLSEWEQTRLPVAFARNEANQRTRQSIMWLAPPLPSQDVFNLFTDLINVGDLDQESTRRLMSRVNPWARFGVEVATGKSLFTGQELGKWDTMPAWMVEMDKAALGGSLQRGLNVEWQADFGSPYYEDGRGSGRYRIVPQENRKNVIAWTAWRNLAQFPGAGRSMDTIMWMDRANTGAVEAFVDATRWFGEGAREAGMSPYLETPMKPDPIGTDVVSPRPDMGEEGEFAPREFWGLLGFKPRFVFTEAEAGARKGREQRFKLQAESDRLKSSLPKRELEELGRTVETTPTP